MFLFRCFSSKKTLPDEDPKAPSASAGASQQQKRNDDVQSGSTWTDDDDETLNSGTQDDPIYRGLYRGMSANSPSVAEATTGENSSARFSDGSTLDTSNDPMLDANNNNKLGRNMMLLGPQHGDHNDDDDDDTGSLFLEKGLYPQHHYTPQQQQTTTTVSVTLPPGKVGMVLNTPPEGSWSAPVVYQIKPTCPVKDQVCVGDRLLSVDGEDCSYMSAVEASRLLSGKVHQPQRVLLFARTR